MRIPFDIKYRPQIESGEYEVIYLSYNTKEESPVRIICWDCDNEYFIVALIINSAGHERVAVFQEEGIDNNHPHQGTLLIVTPEEELSEFENRLCEILDSAINYQIHSTHEETIKDVKKLAPELLAIAREQLIKDGYVIEKKAFNDNEAVEHISDKHQAEMSIQYSTHCKIEDGTRHAVMNWDTFQKVAQKFIDIGKADALKDLPRWGLSIGGFPEGWLSEGVLYYKFHAIPLKALEGLSGFKED